MPISNASLTRKDKAANRPHMEHRHFAYIAAVIRIAIPIDCRIEVAKAFCYHLGFTNDRFDKERFLRACDIDMLEYEQILRDQESMSP